VSGEAAMDPAQPAASLPLTRFEQVHTEDVEQARHVIADAFCPHELTALDSGREFDVRFHAANTGNVSLCYLDYGGRVHLTPSEQETFYLVLMPLAGGAEITCGPEQVAYDATGASVPPVDRPYDLLVRAGSPHLAARISRSRLEKHLRSLLDRPVALPVRFALGMDMTAPLARSWRRAVSLLVDEVDDGGTILDQPLAARELERVLMTQLLIAQPNNYSALLSAQPRRPAPRLVRRAAELIEAHAAEPLTVEDIAEATGVSVRALQEGFRRFLETTPMNYLRDVRLRHAHDELTAADPARTTVTEIAIRWGFLHPSRFSAQYRQRYGESPSATLRR
jgi:AraC-like DNA-binding protein